MLYPYLKDKTFLKSLDQMKIRTTYTKITALTWKEEPIQDITGLVTSGSINIDGSSSVRRTCSLSLYASEMENNITNVEHLFSINKKVKVDIGLENKTKQYPEYPIIWFPMGYYLITSADISHDTSGASISLSLKDKMCLLNGDVGGIIPNAITFNEYETANANGDTLISTPTVYQIIQELVNHLGGEQLPKIIIRDLDVKAKQLMKWSGTDPIWVKWDQGQENSDISTTKKDDYTKITTGQNIGYIYTDFIYPSSNDLVSSPGDSITSMLDTIVNVLGNYEYFYDVYGNFIFQEKKNYLYTTQASEVLSHLNSDNAWDLNYTVDMTGGKSVYDFTNSNIISAYSNSMEYTNVKNDFVIWGSRTDSSGNESLCRYHLAIDEKPEVGNTYKAMKIYDKTIQSYIYKCPIVFATKNDFPVTGDILNYYEDQSTEKIYSWGQDDDNVYTYIELEDSNSLFTNYTTTDWRTELYFQGAVAEPYGGDVNYYYTELKNEWPKIYNIDEGCFKDEVIESPDSLDYWLDFIDSTAAIGELSVNNIGRRTYAKDDDDVKMLFEADYPDWIILNEDDEDLNTQIQDCVDRDIDYVITSASIYKQIIVRTNYNTAYNQVRNALYEHTGYNEAISITCLPIYYLEPNTIIKVQDNKSNISGDYLLNSYSITLGLEGTISLSATKIIDYL